MLSIPVYDMAFGPTQTSMSDALSWTNGYCRLQGKRSQCAVQANRKITHHTQAGLIERPTSLTRTFQLLSPTTQLAKPQRPGLVAGEKQVIRVPITCEMYD